jgi:choline dehydrogenase-like flavoprotein
LTEALVSKLIVADDGAVTGVEFQHSQKSYTVRSKKEVIVSTGSVKSPQILELSGIGNPEILSKAGIKYIVENVRVGENFQDHTAIAIGWELVPGEKTVDELKNLESLQQAVAEYTTTQSGPLSSGGAAMGFVSYANISTPDEIAALQELILHHQPTGQNGAARRLIADRFANPAYASIQYVLLPASLNIASSSSQAGLLAGDPNMEGKQGVTLAVCNTRPLSIGSCHIISADPSVDPAIDPAYITHPADIEILQKGLEYAEKIAAASPLKEKIQGRYYPTKDVDMSLMKIREDYLRGNVHTEYHLAGGVAMGVEGVGAVNERLRARGAKGLRVVDASVMPLHISGNPQATVYAIAEKGADMVNEDWGVVIPWTMSYSLNFSPKLAR